MPPLDRIETTVAGRRVVADACGPDGAPGVLLLHGLAAERRSLRPLTEAVAEHDLLAIAPDLRGHGGSEGLRGMLSRERVLADVAAWTGVLDGRSSPLAAVAGHSLGGLWALAAAETIELDAIACVCSPASIRDETSLPEELLYQALGGVHGLARRLGVTGLRLPYRVGPEDTLDDPDAIAHAKANDLILGSLPLAIIEPLLRLDAREIAPRVDTPALVAVASNDRVVDRGSTRAIYDALAGPKDWLELPGPHDLFLDLEGPQCADEVAAWLAARLT